MPRPKPILYVQSSLWDSREVQEARAALDASLYGPAGYRVFAPGPEPTCLPDAVRSHLHLDFSDGPLRLRGARQILGFFQKAPAA